MSAKFLKRYEAVFLVNHAKGPGLTYKAAAKYIRKSEAFVKKWVQRYLEVGNVDNLPERGLSRATTTKEDKAILRLFQDKPGISLRYAQIKLRKKGIAISLNTIRKRLCEKNVYFRSTLKKPLLLNRHFLIEQTVAIKSATADEPKQTKNRDRQAKASKEDNEVVSEPASSPKKSRSRQRNVADTTTATTTAKTGTKSKSKEQINKEPEEMTVESNNEEVVEKKTRSGKTAAVVKKAGKKATETKSKTKVPIVRKQTKTKDVENSPVQRPRRAKIVEENDAPAQPIAKVSRKRKNVEDTNEAIAEIQTIKENEEEVEENEAKASKKLRGRQKKMETSNAPVVTSKGRSRKNPAEEIVKSPPKKTERKKQNSKEQNAAIQKDNTKTKNVKNTKKGKTQKAASKRKLNAVIEEVNDDQAEESNEAEAVTTSEVDVKENGEAHMAEPKQKKRNVGEAKGKQKKAQVIASVNEEEATQDVTAENEAIKTNVISEIDENDTIVSSSKDDILENEKEKDVSDVNSIKEESTSEISNNERAASFVCL
ncbi:PREDICTED: neurofilament heavy polypeptide-like [Acromyrmex echinatior]|uniref:Uncharacterized protein n=1 Tax=Acromyrmex echinatior TaxID=103372 RepID=F4WPE2_ACREC|nr:PREDICTED: neurofilament heavy polypeptide-like [Acromyrmex echinatior]EGI64037.1 hypothetical protein G5I_07618 [Acromyrmex echinatior]